MIRIIACVVPLVLALAAPSALAESKSCTRVPVLVNVLKGVTITDKEITDMVEHANAILKQACIQLELDPKNDIVRDVPKADPGETGVPENGRINGERVHKLVERGAGELKDKFKAPRGMKVTIANLVNIGINAALGAAIHGPDKPVSFIGRPDDGWGDGTVTGTALAHEFCHLFTLREHSEEPGNLMNPSYEEVHGSGTHLTAPQREEIRKAAERRGLTKEVRDGHAELKNARYEYWIGSAGPPAPAAPAAVMSGGALYLPQPDAALEASLRLQDAASKPLNLRADFVFMPDGDAASQTSTADGASQILSIAIKGRYPFSGGAGSIRSVWTDTARKLTVTLDPAQAAPVELLFDRRRPRGLVRQVVETAFVQSVPAAIVGKLPAQLRVGLRLTDLDSGAQQTADIRFDEASAGAAISIAAEPAGGALAIRGRGFHPHAALEIRLDDKIFGQGRSGDDGTFAGHAAIPASAGQDRFLTVRDDQGAFDFAVLPAGGIKN